MKRTIIDKKYLAETLSFMGYMYNKQVKGERFIYVFDETESFKYALHRVLELRAELWDLKNKQIKL
ncbi:hypothetical protein [Clostridium estertheticum]|uniref:hypothetical protein n=1 Tax=Clostridium estertheticum TaxID=238834 RepID=UPI001C0E2D8B|nr:hypothetical protein [Clostridium estertheticum]MBU3186671.1 hypothetical protein [Clostridium estertheticum]